MVPRHLLFPILLVLTVTGTYVSDNRLFDLWTMLGFGVVGWLLEKGKYPLAPLVLGFVLGPILETNLRRALAYSQGDLTDFVTRPISCAFLILAGVLLVVGIRSNLNNSSNKA